MRDFYLAANWKLNKSPAEAEDYLKRFTTVESDIKVRFPGRQVIFFVPAIDLWVTRNILAKSSIRWGAQNVYFEKTGAFTGENSAAVLAEIGGKFCLVGHSERRALFHETDEETGKKVRLLQEVGVTPMLCVGEVLAERDAGQTSSVILRQMRAGLMRADLAKPVTIAYEPVWAIGTGRVATPAQAQEAHAVLRNELRVLGGAALADNTAILYGGSVKPQNAPELAAQVDIDGFLVGGASLEVETFRELCLTKR